MFRRSPTRKVKQLENRIQELQAENEGLQRAVRVLEVERDALAAVIARDRERVKAETAAYARSVAEIEN